MIKKVLLGMLMIIVLVVLGIKNAGLLILGIGALLILYLVNLDKIEKKLRDVDEEDDL